MPKQKASRELEKPPQAAAAGRAHYLARRLHSIHAAPPRDESWLLRELTIGSAGIRRLVAGQSGSLQPGLLRPDTRDGEVRPRRGT